MFRVWRPLCGLRLLTVRSTRPPLPLPNRRLFWLVGYPAASFAIYFLGLLSILGALGGGDLVFFVTLVGVVVVWLRRVLRARRVGGPAAFALWDIRFGRLRKLAVLGDTCYLEIKYRLTMFVVEFAP